MRSRVKLIAMNRSSRPEQRNHLPSKRHVHVFFLDGVGMGIDSADSNPFVNARMPALEALLGPKWYLQPVNGSPPAVSSTRATIVATDANLGVEGRPQSATGQASILTGINVPLAIGRHYGPKPDPEIAAIIRSGSIFHDVRRNGRSAALLTPYPQHYFDAVNSGRRLYSAIPLAVTDAGFALMTADDLRNGRAISPGFTGKAWSEHLGYDDIPLLTLAEAGAQIARVARDHDLSFFEHWPSDRAGHRGSLSEAVNHLEIVDSALGGLFDAWDDEAGLLIITSDHGNIEVKSTRKHSRNPVPTIVVGSGHEEYAGTISNIADIAQVVRQALELDSGSIPTGNHR